MIDWPAGFERTNSQDRERNSRFDLSLSDSFDELEAELDRLGVEDHRYSFDADGRKTDQRPYSRSNPDDPGFVLRWTMDGQQYAAACDRWSRLRDNVRTVGLYLREKRKMEGRPVETGSDEFANARLPAADDAIEATEPPHAVLGIDPDAADSTIKDAARERIKQSHPDQGGSIEELQRVREAKETLLGGEPR